MIGSERAGVTYAAVNVEGTRSIAPHGVESGATPLVMFSGLGVARYGHGAAHHQSLLPVEAGGRDRGCTAAACPRVVFRPSYIMGPGDGLSTALLRDLAAGVVEVPGDGRYRMQPIAVADAAEAALSAALDPPQPVGRSAHRVIDLVGPEPHRLRPRSSSASRTWRERSATRPTSWCATSRWRRPTGRRVAGGYRGMAPDELDCLLCDEVAEAAPLSDLLGRPLRPLDEAIAAAVDDTPHPQ